MALRQMFLKIVITQASGMAHRVKVAGYVSQIPDIHEKMKRINFIELSYLHYSMHSLPIMNTHTHTQSPPPSSSTTTIINEIQM